MSYQQTEIGDIPSHWDIKPLPNILSFIVDNRGKTVPTANSGIPLIATNCIVENGLYPVKEKIRFVSQETYDTWFRSHPEPNDIVFVNKGTPGQVCLVPNPVDFCIAQDMVAIRANKNEVDWKFLFAYLRSGSFKKQVQGLNVGTTIPHLKKGVFNQLRIPLPTRKEQEIIGNVYYTLSEKIELNVQMNATLERIAQATFKQWFVDFKFPYFDGELAAGLPKGWSIGKLGDISINVRKSVNPKDVNSDTPYFGLEHLPSKSIALSSWGKADDAESLKSKFSAGDILFGKIRPYFHKVGVAPVDGICSTDILVIQPKQREFFGLALTHFSSDAVVNYATSLSNGAKMPRTSWNDLANYEICIPTVNIAKEFSELICSFTERIKNNIFENQTLTQLRDGLLPKLMSGKIRV